MRSRIKRVLQRLGLVNRSRTLTDLHRRQIRTMIEGGVSDAGIAEFFGFSATEIESARRSDFITGTARSSCSQANDRAFLFSNHLGGRAFDLGMEIAMPRFYLNMRIDGILVVDHEGTEFADLDAAVEDAKAAARNLIAIYIRYNDPSVLQNSFEITDEHRTAVRTVHFTESLRPEFQQALRGNTSI